MKIGFLLPTLFASSTLFPDRIFAPGPLAQDTINGLVAKGHGVYVFSTSDFMTHGKLIAGDSEAFEKKLSYYKLQRAKEENAAIRNDEIWKRSFELSVTTQAYAYAKKEKLDVMHSYHDFLFTPHYFEEVTGIPTVYTLHDPPPPEGSFEYHEFEKFKHHHFVSISDAQRQSSLPLNFTQTVYHGINLSHFSFQEKASDYLLFMGRLVPEKGLHSAISVALTLNMQLEIGTHFPDWLHESEYFKLKIKPYLSDPLIGEPGMVAGENKQILYKQAKALLFPIEWEEPFGIVMIEAMACGTPVIAYNRGSVAEIVRDGVTGFIVEPAQPAPNTTYKAYTSNTSYKIKKKGIAGLIEAVQRIGEIDRKACRKHVEEHFTVEKMVEGYEKVYQKVLENK